MNRILGHSEHLKNNIMYLNCVGVIKHLIDSKQGKYLMYDTFGRKQNGLVMFKKRIGFKAYTINFQ